MSNTIIQMKRSSNTAIPPNGALASGQPGYSFLSDQFFVGNAAGTGVLTIGGKIFVDKVSAAASANGSNTLVMRDLSGDFAARHITATQVIGNASSANTLSPGRYIASGGEISGNVAFDGSTNINLALALAATGVTAGVYGDATTVPVITVDSKGRITSASNVAITGVGGGSGNATFNILGNTGSNVANSGTNIIFRGVDGISSTVTGNTGNITVQHSVDSTVIRTTGGQTISGNLTVSSDMTIGGNLNVLGTWTVFNANELNIGDNLVVLNSNLAISSAPTLDAGFIINRGNLNSNAQIYWDETNDWWTAVGNNILSGASALGRIHTDSYANATALSTGTVPSARLTGSYTGITGLGTITVGTWQGTNIAVGFGGTGRSSFTLGGVLYGNATGDLIATAAPTEGKVLQGSAGGLPIWGDLDGGTF